MSGSALRHAAAGAAVVLLLHLLGTTSIVFGLTAAILRQNAEVQELAEGAGEPPVETGLAGLELLSLGLAVAVGLWWLGQRALYARLGRAWLRGFLPTLFAALFLQGGLWGGGVLASTIDAPGLWLVAGVANAVVAAIVVGLAGGSRRGRVPSQHE